MDFSSYSITAIPPTCTTTNTKGLKSVNTANTVSAPASVTATLTMKSDYVSLPADNVKALFGQYMDPTKIMTQSAPILSYLNLTHHIVLEHNQLVL